MTSTRLSLTSGRPLLGRYKDQVPVDLARVQAGKHVRLRDYESQIKLKRFSYDLKLKDGKVYPAEEDHFIGADDGSRVCILKLIHQTWKIFRPEWMLVTGAIVAYISRDCSEL